MKHCRRREPDKVERNIVAGVSWTKMKHCRRREPDKDEDKLSQARYLETSLLGSKSQLKLRREITYWGRSLGILVEIRVPFEHSDAFSGE
ncbi:hypothetical protein A2U01_0046093 [Trifolium medium]|uniref:Uncharacterized protein n=1 Tax=Trifolium medium TaxID=97028 RepID=A0A392QMZ8_9FABA|nr:hypothetical protein [Trifolium medium]